MSRSSTSRSSSRCGPETALVAGTSPKLQAPFDAARAAPHELVVAMTPWAAGRRARLVCTWCEARGRATTRRGLRRAREPARRRSALPAAVGRWRRESCVARVDPVGRCERSDVDRRRTAAWRYSVAQDEWNRENDGMHDYTRLHTLEDRGQRWAIAADVGFGLAAATAVTAAILFATGASSERAASRSPARAPAFVARSF